MNPIDPDAHSMSISAQNAEILLRDQIEATKELNAAVEKFTKIATIYSKKSDKSSKIMIWLTVAIVFLTILMLIGLAIQICIV